MAAEVDHRPLAELIDDPRYGFEVPRVQADNPPARSNHAVRNCRFFSNLLSFLRTDLKFPLERTTSLTFWCIRSDLIIDGFLGLLAIVLVGFIFYPPAWIGDLPRPTAKTPTKAPEPLNECAYPQRALKKLDYCIKDLHKPMGVLPIPINASLYTAILAETILAKNERQTILDQVLSIYYSTSAAVQRVREFPHDRDIQDPSLESIDGSVVDAHGEVVEYREQLSRLGESVMTALQIAEESYTQEYGNGRWVKVAQWGLPFDFHKKLGWDPERKILAPLQRKKIIFKAATAAHKRLQSDQDHVQELRDQLEEIRNCLRVARTCDRAWVSLPTIDSDSA
ncbi:MAG: hypothetical protein Q9220_007758 [cf. Caloplaca sp. 1 TL-2023]